MQQSLKGMCRACRSDHLAAIQQDSLADHAVVSSPEPAQLDLDALTSGSMPPADRPIEGPYDELESTNTVSHESASNLLHTM